MALWTCRLLHVCLPCLEQFDCRYFQLFLIIPVTDPELFVLGVEVHGELFDTFLGRIGHAARKDEGNERLARLSLDFGCA